MSTPASSSVHSAECFALLDDSSAPGRSRLYTGFVRALSCVDANALATILGEMEQALRQGLYAVGVFDYELGAQLQQIASEKADSQARAALAQVLLFSKLDMCDATQVSQWLASDEPQRGVHINPAEIAGIAGINASVDAQQFEYAIARIHAYIEAGDTYQINYTYRLHFDAYGSPVGLYQRLRARQPVPYGALICLPDGGAVLSLSPELFVRHTAGELVAQPMKGTARASGDEQVDAQLARKLAADAKNRAENLMIVDLLRNDLGRIAELGTVSVPALFDVRRYANVLQMTSTVTARARSDVRLHDVFAALYPCGSITGAPKRRTMEIIDELETEPRGLYTGAIGWFDRGCDAAPMGDFCLSVPIRTLALQAPERGMRRGVLGVGAGIVYDSEAAQEHAECELKASFLTGLRPQFSLIETMRIEHGQVLHLQRHLQRLQKSAQYFGFAKPEADLADAIQSLAQEHAAAPLMRARLELSPQGQVQLTCAPMTGITGPVNLLIASQRNASDDIFLQHKTTIRERYDAAWKQAEEQGAFDMLFFNEHGQLCEGGRSNVFVRLDGRWYTPKLAAGLLPGVMRSVLLDDPAWGAQERDITLDDLRRAEAAVACNALRGAMPAQLVWPAES